MSLEHPCSVVVQLVYETRDFRVRTKNTKRHGKEDKHNTRHGARAGKCTGSIHRGYSSPSVTGQAVNCLSVNQSVSKWCVGVIQSDDDDDDKG